MSWDDADEEEPTIDCPHCRGQIHEDSQRWPHCGNYLSAEETSTTTKPWWLILGVAVCLYLVYRWIVV